MPTTNTKTMPTIGVDKYTFFKLLTDTKEGATYEEGITLEGTKQITPNDSGTNSVYDADNGPYVSIAGLENIGHELSCADIPPDVDAQWRGVEKGENGVVMVGDNPGLTYFAVAWRTLKADGTYRYVKYLKGTYSFASNVGGTTKPSSGSIEFQDATATYTAVKRDYDGNYYSFIDQVDIPETEKDTFEENWFSDASYFPGDAAEEGA